MNQNDIIAEYVRKNRPEILTSMNFAFFKCGMIFRDFADQCVKSIKDFDFALKAAATTEDGLKVEAPIIDEIHPDEAYCKPGKKYFCISIEEFNNICESAASFEELKQLLIERQEQQEGK